MHFLKNNPMKNNFEDRYVGSDLIDTTLKIVIKIEILTKLYKRISIIFILKIIYNFIPTPLQYRLLIG